MCCQLYHVKTILRLAMFIKTFQAFLSKNRSGKFGAKYFVYFLIYYTYAKLKGLNVKLFPIYSGHFKFAPKINFKLLWFCNPLPLTSLQSTSLAAVLNVGEMQAAYLRIHDIHSHSQHLVNNDQLLSTRFMTSWTLPRF